MLNRTVLRTLHSFENAMYKLGGKVSILNHQYSSIQKGESLDGTEFYIVSNMCVIYVKFEICKEYTHLSIYYVTHR